MNSRLDELQAALLRVGLRHLAAWTERRRALAAFYARELEGAGVELLREQPYARAVFHLFVVRHPRRDALMAALARARRGDAHPLPDPPPPSNTSSNTAHNTPRIAGALALGMAHVIIEEGLYDRDFVDKWTLGFEEYKNYAKGFTPEVAEGITGVPAELITKAARLYATTKPAAPP